MEELRRFRMQLKELHESTNRRAQDPGYVPEARRRFAEMSIHLFRAMEASRGELVPEATSEVHSELVAAICNGELR